MNKTALALSWLGRGVAVIPVGADKRAAIAWKRYQDELPTYDQVLTWLRVFPGYGVVCGWQGLTILDFDSFDGYLKWRTWATEAGGLAAEVAETTHQVVTSRGVHVYLWCDVPQRTRHFEGLDVIGSGGYVLGAGSLHPSGTVYGALDEHAQPVRVTDVLGVLPPWALLTPLIHTRLQPAQPVAPPPTSAPIDSDPWACATRALSGRELFDRAKQAAPIWEILGVPLLRRSGANYWLTQCPLHEDHAPSMSVDVESNRASCFAGCTAPHGWDAVDAAMWRYGLGPVEAAKWLVGR